MFLDTIPLSDALRRLSSQCMFVVSPTEQGFNVSGCQLTCSFFHRSAAGGLSFFFLIFMRGCVYVHVYVCCEVYVTTLT